MSRTLDNLKYVQVESSVLSQSQFSQIFSLEINPKHEDESKWKNWDYNVNYFYLTYIYFVFR